MNKLALNENTFYLKFKRKENFNIDDFEKYLFTINYIDFKYKPIVKIEQDLIIIKINNNDFRYKINIYNQILEYKNLDELLS